MTKYYVVAFVDNIGFVSYFYKLHYNLDTKEGLIRLTKEISEEKGNAVIIFFKELKLRF